MSLAKTKSEFLELLSKNSLPIKNVNEAKDIVTNKFSDKLDKNEIITFLDGCTFVGNGIAHFNYEILARKLTYVELYEFMELFGISGELFDEVKDARCDGKHNCTYAVFSTCMPSC